MFTFWTLCIFEPPFEGLGTTYNVQLGLIGNCVMDLLLVLSELLSLGVTAEALRAKIDRKSAISLQRGHSDMKISGRKGRPINHFCIDSLANESLTTLLLTIFTQRNFVADFLQPKCDFKQKRQFCSFKAPVRGLGQCTTIILD